MLPELLVLVTESLRALAASLAAPLATFGTSSTPALAAMPLLLVVDGEGHHSLFQGCLLPQGGLLLQCGWLDGRHNRLLGVSGVPDGLRNTGLYLFLDATKYPTHLFRVDAAADQGVSAEGQFRP